MPLTGLSSLAPLGARAGRLRFTPEEEDDILGQLAGAGASAVGVVGDVLDTIGGPIRTALSGQDLDRVLASIVDPSQRVSGRDMLQSWGVVGENYEGLDMGDVLGFGAEIATDPLTFVGSGVTKAGSLAKALGKFPKRSLFDVGTGALSLGKRAARRAPLRTVLEGADDATMKLAEKLATKKGTTLAAMLDEPMQRSLGVGLPFKDNAFTFDLPGAAGRANLLDKIGGKARMSRPGRELARLFDRSVRNVTSGKVQEFSKNFTEAAEPAMAEAEARMLQANDELLSLGVNDPDVRRNLLEGFHDSAPRRQLTPDESVALNLPQGADEALDAYTARTEPVKGIMKGLQSEQDKLFRRQTELGIRNPYQYHERHYSFRAGTREGMEPNFNKARTKGVGDVATTVVNRAMQDTDFIEMAKATDVDQLSAEALSRRPPERIQEYLHNVGYEDIEDVVDWQAKGMLGADPQRAAQNYNAVEQTAIGMGDAPELSRTVVPPRPETDLDALQAARSYVLTNHLGVPQDEFAKMGQWLEEAKALPELRKEYEELADAARASDYNPSLAEQELTWQGKLNEAESALEAYRASKSRLDSRDIFSRQRDEYFDIDRLTPEELSALESTQQRAMQGTEAARRRFAELTSEFATLRKEANKLNQKTPTINARVHDVGTRKRASKEAAKMLDEHNAKLTDLNARAKAMEDEAESIRLMLQDSLAAKDELAAMETQYRQRGYFAKGDSQFLTDQELRDLAALRNTADTAGLYRNRLKKVQERMAAGERQVYPGEYMDELQAKLGAAEASKAKLDAMKLVVEEADGLIRLGKKYGEGRFFNNDVLVDRLGKEMFDRRAIAWQEQFNDAVARWATRTLPEGTKGVPLIDVIRQGSYAGKDASSTNQAVRNVFKRMGEVTDDDALKQVANNIAGPDAVATSGVRNDKAAAQIMRDQEIMGLRERLYTMKQGQIRDIQASKTLSGAEKAEAIAGIERRFNEEASAKISELAKSPLPDVSKAGNVMRTKKALRDEAIKAAEESRAMGLLDDKALRLEKDRIDKWFKSPTASLGGEYDEIMARVRAENVIPNDGLLAIKEFMVPEELVDQLKRAKSLWEQPGQEGTVGKLLDKWRQITKAHLTLPHPGFHGRNIQGSIALYATLRAFDPTQSGLKKLTQPLQDMWNILRGKGVRDVESIPQIKALGLKGKDAERWLLSQLSAKGNLRGTGDILSEGYEATFTGDLRRSVKGGESAEQFASNVPGANPVTAEYLKQPFRKGKARFNPLKPDEFALTSTGARFSNITENTFRGAAMIGLMRQGKTADEAAALMKAAFVDYSDLTKWERNFARRVIPFYSWLRKASAYAVRDLMEHPAGFNAQIARLARVSEQDAGFLPPQLGGSMAIPIGQEEDGTQRYLAQFDFPVETLNRLVNPAGASETLRSLVAQTTPELKWVLETAFGKSAFRGRNLDDLESTTGRLAANLTGAEEPLWRSNILDNILANSPASRYVGTATQAGDSRKSWPDFLLQQGTGVKLQDVEMDKARSIAASKGARELLGELGGRTQEVMPRLSKEDLAKLSPQDRAEAERLQAVLDLLAKRRRAEKK